MSQPQPPYHLLQFVLVLFFFIFLFFFENKCQNFIQRSNKFIQSKTASKISPAKTV